MIFSCSFNCIFAATRNEIIILINLSAYEASFEICMDDSRCLRSFCPWCTYTRNTQPLHRKTSTQSLPFAPIASNKERLKENTYTRNDDGMQDTPPQRRRPSDCTYTRKKNTNLELSSCLGLSNRQADVSMSSSASSIQWQIDVAMSISIHIYESRNFLSHPSVSCNTPYVHPCLHMHVENHVHALSAHLDRTLYTCTWCIVLLHWWSIAGQISRSP